MTHPAAPFRFARPWLAAAACVALTGGCSSVITSAYLRDAWLDTLDRSAGDADDDDTAPRGRRRGAATASDEPAQEPAPAPLTLAEAVAAAESRLADAGGLSAAARSTLVATLEATPPQDWPVVVEEFAAALAAVAGPVDRPSMRREDPVPRGESTPREEAEPQDRAAVPPPSPAPPADASAPEPPPLPGTAAAAPPSEPVATAAPVPPAPSTAAQAAAAEPPAPQPPALSVVNACFASRVRAWGVVDRFETARFRPGQQVILYFEIENLSSRQSAEGHTTCVDTRLALVAADGTRLHAWTFDPLEESCLSKRRDYFARYVLELPEGLPPGPCRLEVAVDDALAGRAAATALPLEIAAR